MNRISVLLIIIFSDVRLGALRIYCGQYQANGTVAAADTCSSSLVITGGPPFIVLVDDARRSSCRKTRGREGGKPVKGLPGEPSNRSLELSLRPHWCGQVGLGRRVAFVTFSKPGIEREDR